MTIPWPAIAFSVIVLISVITALGILFYKNKLKRLRPKTTTTKSITTEDVEAAATVPQKTKPKSFEKNNSITRISTPPFKDKVEPLPNFGGKFVRPCHVAATKSMSSFSIASQTSLPSIRIQTPPTVPVSTPTELRPPVNLADRRPSATELIEAELMGVGELPLDLDFASEIEEREKQKRKYKGLQS